MSAQKRSYRRSTLAGKRPSLLMALEPRMLYDGAGAEVVADAAAAEALVPQDSGAAAQETAGPENGAASQPAAEPAEAGAQETAAGEGPGSADDAATAPAVSGQEEAGSAAGGTSPAAATNGNSAANTTAASHDAGAAPPDAEDEETAAAATEAAAAGSSDHDDQSGPDADTAEPLAGLEGQSIRQLVFVDSAVRDHQTLVNGISGGSDAGPAGTVGTSGYTLSGTTLVVTLGEKPLDDMAAVLEHCHDLDAVHLVSHGSEGELMLGGSRINAGNLGEHAELFERLGKSLSADGDLLLYGCKVGRDGAGQAFIDQVAALSGADVNASTDDTGNASSGGNWDLEVATGPIETAALLNEQNAGNWQGRLSDYTLHWGNSWPAFPPATEKTYTVGDTTIKVSVSNEDVSSQFSVKTSTKNMPTGTGLLVSSNQKSKDGKTIITLEFSNPQHQVSKVEFDIRDIDINGGWLPGHLYGFRDLIIAKAETSSGQTCDLDITQGQETMDYDADNDGNANESLSKGNKNVQSNMPGDAGNEGTAHFKFTSSNDGITKITLIYTNGPDVRDNPGDQTISLTDIHFTCNDPPVANPDVATTPEDTPLNNIDVLGNDSDPDGDPLSVTGATVDPAQGTVSVNPDGTLNFVPAPGFTGTATISYTISDGHGGTATSTLTVTVQPAPEAPSPGGSGTHRPSPAHPDVPAAPFGSTGLHILYGSPDTGHGPGAGPWSGGQTAAGPEAAFAGTGAEGSETPRMLGLDTSLDFDHNGDQLVGTEISQYIHDTVNHTWERVERWYGTGTPGAELLRYDALGGAQDPFNGFHSPTESRMLEDLGRLLDNVVSGSALSGDGASGLLPVFAESRTLQNQLSRADIMGREVDRLSRIMDGGH